MCPGLRGGRRGGFDRLDGEPGGVGLERRAVAALGVALGAVDESGGGDELADAERAVGGAKERCDLRGHLEARRVGPRLFDHHVVEVVCGAVGLLDLADGPIHNLAVQTELHDALLSDE